MCVCMYMCMYICMYVCDVCDVCDVCMYVCMYGFALHVNLESPSEVEHS